MLVPDTLRFFLLRCVMCESVTERGLDVRQLTVLRGQFVPVECPRCGDKAAVPTARPWELSFNDRKLLRQLRITIE